MGIILHEQLETSNSHDVFDSEIQIFQNALDFHKLKAREVMVPRTEMIAVEFHETIAEFKKDICCYWAF